MVTCMDSGASLPEAVPPLHHFPALRLGVLCLSSPACKMKIIIVLNSTVINELMFVTSKEAWSDFGNATNVLAF